MKTRRSCKTIPSLSQSGEIVVTTRSRSVATAHVDCGESQKCEGVLVRYGNTSTQTEKHNKHQTDSTPRRQIMVADMNQHREWWNKQQKPHQQDALHYHQERRRLQKEEATSNKSFPLRRFALSSQRKVAHTTSPRETK